MSTIDAREVMGNRAAGAAETTTARPTVVRDLPVRLFHGSLILLIPAAWATYEFGRVDLHIMVGYAILTLLLWRLMWGFVGSETARFARLLKRPGDFVAQLRTLGRRGGSPPAGYGAIGGLAVLVLLGILLVQATLGLFSQDNPQMTGPLADRVSQATSERLTDWHDWLFFTVIVPLLALHIVAALFHHLWKRDPIVTSMITGRKPVEVPAPVLASNGRALACLGIAAVLVVAVAQF